MKDTIILDLDGTLCDNSHRVTYAKMGMWDDFHSRLMDDEPFEDVLSLVQEIQLTAKILAVTGRNARYRPLTNKWFDKIDFYPNDLLMRPDDNFKSDFEMKLGMIETYFGGKEHVLEHVAFALEDRDRVVEAFRNYGIPTWQVRAGEY